MSQAKSLISLIISICLCLCLPTVAFADESLEEKTAKVLNEINELNTRINQLEENYTEAIAERDEIRQQMDEIEKQIEAKTAEISLLQERLGTRVSQIYRNGQMSFLDVFLGVDSFEAFASNWELYQRINSQDARLIQEVKEMRETIEQEQAKYAALEQEAIEKIAVAAYSKTEAEELLKEAEQVYADLSAEAERIVAQVEERQGEINRNAEIVATGNAIVDRAYGELGKPYVWGAVGPHSYDCSGLVSYCISGQNTRLGTTSTFMTWSRVSDPIPGDICTNDHHCGIYIGNGQMIHAPRSGDVIKISPVHTGMIYVRP